MPHGYADDGSDMWTPPGWKRPDWWTDELDDTGPLARWEITTRAKASSVLYRKKNAGRLAALQAHRSAARKLRAATGKIAEYTQKLAAIEAERARLAAIVVKQDCRGELKADGSPYLAFYDVERDLEKVARKVPQYRSAIARWQRIDAEGEIPASPPTKGAPRAPLVL